MTDAAPQLLLPADRKIVDNNGVQLSEEHHDREVAELEFWLARNVCVAVVNTYPNRNWSVVADAEGGVLILLAPDLSKFKGHFIHMGRKTLHELQTQAIKAAGEILERHGVSRSNVFKPEFIEGLKRNARDEVVTADSAPEPIAP